MRIWLTTLTAIFAVIATLSANARAEIKVPAPEDSRPAPCFEDMCPVCQKLGSLATIWACTAVIDDKATETSARAEAFAERAAAHGMRKEYTAQIDDISSAIDEMHRYMVAKHIPHSAFLNGYYMQRAFALCKAGRYADCIEDLQKSTPEGLEGGLLEMRAWARWHLGQYDAALKDADDLIGVSNVWPSSYFLRGVIRTSMKNPTGAVEDFTKAIRILRADIEKYRNTENFEPADVALLAKALYQRSLAYRATDDSAQADADLAEAKSLGADYAGAVDLDFVLQPA